jgi:polar amino acid transport system substrate-binding protein
MRRRHFLAALPLFAAGLMNPGAGGAAAVLRVGAALPDPPFEFNDKDGPAGFDVTLMQRIAAMIGREWRLVPFTGSDFNGIFAGLDGAYASRSPTSWLPSIAPRACASMPMTKSSRRSMICRAAAAMRS